MSLQKVLRSIKKFSTKINGRFYITTSSKTYENEQGILEENWKQRCKLATAYRAFEKYNMHEGVCNHLSALAPSVYTDSKVALIIPYGLYWAEATPENLVGIDIATLKTVEGKDEPELTAKSIHCGIYQNRDDIKSVMHLHSQYATILSVLQFYCCANSIVGKQLAIKKVLIMGSHGIATVGKTVHEAFDYMYYFEKAAEVQVLAYQTGKPLLMMKDDTANKIYEVLEDTHHEYSKSHLYGLMNHFRSIDRDFIKSN